MPRAISIRSATTAEAVGPAPAPRPCSNTVPTKSPSASTALNTPSTAASGAVSGTIAGCTRISMPASVSPRDAQQLDPVAQLLGEADIQRGDRGGCPRHARRRNPPAAPNASAARIASLCAASTPSISKRRIGLGIAKRLRIGQHVGEFAPSLAHRGQDIIAGAVQNAGDPADPVAGQTFAQAP